MVHGNLPWQHSFGYLKTYWPCAGELSAVNAIGAQLRDPINSGLARWRMAVKDKYMDADEEIGRDPVSKHQIQPEYGNEKIDASRETKFSGANADRETSHHEQDWQPYPVDPYSCYI